MNKDKRKGILFTIIGAICWGISGCFGQYLFIEKNMTAEWLVTIRLLVAGFCMVIMGLIVEKEKMWVIFKNKKDTQALLLFSLLGMLMCQYTYFAAIEHSNAGTATVLQALNPILVLIYMCIKGKRNPQKIEVGAIFLALTGVFLLSTRGNIQNMVISEKALFLGLSSAVGAALYNILSQDIVGKYGIYVVLGFGMSIGGLGIIPLVRPWELSIIWDWHTIVALVGVIIIGTMVAFGFYLKGVSVVGAFMGSLLGTIEPVVAVLVSIIFLNSNFYWIEMVGFILILATVIILSINSKKESIVSENQ